jgi:hypothetical protein
MANSDLKFISERICIDLAHKIKELNGKATLDDVLPVCAAPAVIIDFKNEDEQDLKLIMKSIKRFVKRNNRFKNMSKSAIVEGLKIEWLPNLDFDEKANMLADYRIFDGVDDEGYILFNEKIYTAFANQEKPDRAKYGTLPYEPKSSSRRSVRKPKVLLTSVEPDPLLADKMKPYVEWYKSQFEHISSADIEGYKWKATQSFQDNFDIDATNLYENLKIALKDEHNLLSGSFNYSKDTLLKNASFSQEDIRFALRNLFDESVVLADRVDIFINRFIEIHSANRAEGKFRQNEQASQNDHSVSVYLAFRYPSKHYIYKWSVWNDAKAEMGLEYPSLTYFPNKLFGYELICNQIRKVLLSDKELVAKHDAIFPNDLSDYHLLTQDFLYSIACHFDSFDKPSIH